MSNPQFRCTQAELYAVARTGWNSYIENLAAFSATRGYYDTAFATTAINAIDAAEALPDDQARYAQVEVLRIELVQFADICLDRWQFLKRYISTSFPEPTQKARLEEAGFNRYPKASNYNWEELKLLNTQALNFIHTHNAALTAGNNMPAGFESDYTTDTQNYAVKYQSFLDEEELAYEATEAKTNANNKVYTDLMTMFKDGQEIFKNNEPLRRQFTFETVLSLVSSPGTAGLRGTIIDAVTGLPLVGVTVRAIGTSYTATTDAAGKYSLTPMASGSYTIQATVVGYQDFSSDKTVLLGTVSGFNFAMQAV